MTPEPTTEPTEHDYVKKRTDRLVSSEVTRIARQQSLVNAVAKEIEKQQAQLVELRDRKIRCTAKIEDSVRFLREVFGLTPQRINELLEEREAPSQRAAARQLREYDDDEEEDF